MRCAILAVMLNTAAHVEILRGGLMSIPHGELECGQ